MATSSSWHIAWRHSFYRLRVAIEALLWIYLLMPPMWLLNLVRPSVIAVIRGERFGPFISEPDKLLRLTRDDPHNRPRVLFGVVGPVCNRAVLQLLRSKLTIIESPLLYHSMMRALNSSRRLKERRFLSTQRDVEDYAQAFAGPPVLQLPTDLEQKCRTYQRSRGQTDSAWHICIHARDDAFLRHAFPDTDWTYQAHRNCRIGSYLPAAKAVTERGGYVYRMGAHVEVPLGDVDDARIVDYAVTDQDDELDVGLIASSRFFLGSTSGLYSLATSLSVPVAMANVLPLDIVPYSRRDMFIPKLLRRRADGRILTFREMADIGIFSPSGGGGDAKFYHAANLEVIDNSPEEIRDLALEMLDRLDGIPPQQGAVEAQAAFKRRFLGHLDGFENFADIGGRFILRHASLMD